MSLLAGHSPESLIHLVRSLAQRPVLPEPGASRIGSIAATIALLLGAHRRYVDEDPDRFAAINDLAAIAIIEQRELREPLAQRHRRTHATALQHLEQLHDAGLVGQPRNRLPAIAALLVNTANGIELDHLEHPDDQRRAAAYRELNHTLDAHLSGPSFRPF